MSDDGEGSSPRRDGGASESGQLLSLTDVGLTSDALLARLGEAQPYLSQLTALEVQRNALDALPSRLLGHLRNLICLDVSRNRLTEIPQEIALLGRLRSLNALSNHLRPAARSLPLPELASLASLERIDLRYNKKLSGARGDACMALLRQHVPQASCVLVTGVEQQQQQKQQQQQQQQQDEEEGHWPESNAPGDAFSLRAQLEPLSTPQLRRRLAADFGCPTDHDVNRHGVMQRLLRAYENEGPRRRVACAGRPLDPALAQQLLQALRATPWHQIPNERRSVRASSYFTIKRKRAAHGPHARLWHAAAEALASVISSDADKMFAANITALAVSRNFTGSPHIDTHDRDVQFAFSCGAFGDPPPAPQTGTVSPDTDAQAPRDAAAGAHERGGKLCVELSARVVAEVDTHMKIAKVDGRFPHWVCSRFRSLALP